MGPLLQSAMLRTYRLSTLDIIFVVFLADTKNYPKKLKSYTRFEFLIPFFASDRSHIKKMLSRTLNR